MTIIPARCIPQKDFSPFSRPARHPRTQPNLCPSSIPDDLRAEYTMNDTVSVLNYFIDERHGLIKQEVLDKAIEKFLQGQYLHYGSDVLLFDALDQPWVQDMLRGADVLIPGSQEPVYEAILLLFDVNSITTTDYRNVSSEVPKITGMHVEEFWKNPKKYDVIFSISNFEHDGLGRYGDPLNPNGDLEAMAECKSLLHPGGRLFLQVPVGKEALVWNAHRIYGPNRLKKMTEGWTVEAVFGLSSALFRKPLGTWHDQPLFILRNLDPDCPVERNVNLGELLDRLLQQNLKLEMHNGS